MIDVTNFRTNYNVDLSINSGDAITVRNRFGQSLNAAPGAAESGVRQERLLAGPIAPSLPS